MTRELILVVEDNEANQMLARAVLELEGFEVRIAGDAVEARVDFGDDDVDASFEVTNVARGFAAVVGTARRVSTAD